MNSVLPLSTHGNNCTCVIRTRLNATNRCALAKLLYHNRSAQIEWTQFYAQTNFWLSTRKQCLLSVRASAHIVITSLYTLRTFTCVLQRVKRKNCCFFEKALFLWFRRFKNVVSSNGSQSLEIMRNALTFIACFLLIWMHMTSNNWSRAPKTRPQSCFQLLAPIYVRCIWTLMPKSALVSFSAKQLVVSSSLGAQCWHFNINV